MVNLTEQGYLRQPHTSSGRVPSPKAMKFYISQLMEENQMSLGEEVKSREKARVVKDDLDKLMGEVTDDLAEQTGALALSAIDDGRVWRSGLANIFDSPEFSLEVCRDVFEFLEESGRLREVFFERMTGLSPVEVLFGEELGWPHFERVGVVASRFNINDHDVAIGIIGPVRLKYGDIIPAVRYFSNLLTQW